MRIFGRKDSSAGLRGASADRVPRHSSGWKELLKHLQTRESLRILDIGPTSSTNINFITGLGHSIYMANLVEEAAKPEWMSFPPDGGEAKFNVERFLASNLNFSGRVFDVVIFWDSSDYLPEALLAPVFDRLHDVMQPGGLLLAFFHAKPTAGSAPPSGFYRYHLTGNDFVDMQPAGNYALRNLYNNRQIENLLHAFSTFRFFLAKDNIREVIATR